ncbi:hypothetical protein EDL98_08285 [Ornithobacterium rhinotracheale]|uniref:hypothetical protein n=1 Tax=Ornithobacterium rhinotracheale TaxID=28251 RepID=UPI00129D0EFB|nr:hypothetical protein [Ornithobacterium rhinotracheale]MRJ11076.1 hypothetical protein [Ornithobacterium rhinotracheale]
MKSNQEILDEFGKYIVSQVYDDSIKYLDELIGGHTKWGTGKEYTEIFQKLNSEEKKILHEYVDDTIRTVIFGMLSIFEENEEYKIIYEEDGQQVDLVKISEMLKAEPLGENGWIDRFSKYAGERDK